MQSIALGRHLEHPWVVGLVGNVFSERSCDPRVTNAFSVSKDMYDELMMTIGSRRSGLNQNLALKSQYERALQDLADLLETGQEKMAGDQKMIVSSKEEIQQLLDKHKVERETDREVGGENVLVKA